jgi:site-specific DNA-methyltransferase (adenine-specific)
MMMRSEIINGDSLEELKKFPDNYFHSVVTDPPYGLSFMGKKWDYNVPSVELWKEVLRVLKPGGYLLAFAGTKTQHRMAVAIEDAGFEIRDMIAWVYGSGFPKSHNIGKAVDKLQGNEREIVGKGNYFCKGRKSSYGDGNIYGTSKEDRTETKGNSEWEGWGTALKPALEPITMARKPFKGTVANNVLKNGVGGINIDGCRVGMSNKDFSEYKDKRASFENSKGNADKTLYKLGFRESLNKTETKGRFPANFIHDGSDEVKDLFPYTKNGAINMTKHSAGKENIYNLGVKRSDKSTGGSRTVDSGSASRFFYCAKASKQDRNEGCEGLEEKKANKNGQGLGRECSLEKRKQENKDDLIRMSNNHPTVKPTDLMRYLVRLVTPKNGIVLDCFMGSGSTGKACALEGFEFVGIDLDKDYCEIARARIDKAIEDKRIEDSQMKLF